MRRLMARREEVSEFFNASNDGMETERARRIDVCRWTPFSERMPPSKSGYLLVTNNVEARDAFGKASHVWLVSMVHTHEHGPSVMNGKTLAEQGEITAFAEPSWMLLRNLTHWRFALPEEAL